MAATSDMSEQILDAAQLLVQTRGYNAFSYADIAAAVGIRKASIHYHYPGKGDLGRRLVERFRETCRAALAEIDRTAADPRARLERYAALFQATLDNDRMCLCGMLASEFASLPDGVRAEVVAAFADHEAWLIGVLQVGQRAGHFRADVLAQEQARGLIAGLEGATLLARLHDDTGRFQVAAQGMLAALEADR